MTNFLDPVPERFKPPKKVGENSLDELDELKKKHDNHQWGSEENDEQYE